MNILEKARQKFILGQDKSGNRQILHLTWFFACMFLCLIIYILYFVYTDSDEVINNSYNKREALYAERTIRGDILSRNGEVLAFTDISSGEEVRQYPYGRIFAHVVGYNSKGKAGIENLANFRLLSSNVLFTERIKNDILGKKNPGDSVVTTLDLNTQIAAYNALSGRKGAVVVMNVSNGHILAMVSEPDFDPNDINALWDPLMQDTDNAILLNRCVQGLYPPGSTFKIVTALEYIKEKNNVSDYEFECPGYFEYKGTKINCYHGASHGEVDFNTSFAKSCNASFANITTKLDRSQFRNTCEELLFNKSVPSPAILNNRSSMTAKSSLVPVNSKSDIDELMQTGIGQGMTSISPYHMCLISAAIANGGMLMNPVIVSEIETAYGDSVYTMAERKYKRLISEEDSVKVKELMRSVITDGTGTKLLDSNGYLAYGKTGSAEFSNNKAESHAWFTGFAEGETSGDTIAIAVIVENGGSGGQVAVPIAKSVFDAYYNQ